jgi:cytochrome P450
VDATGEEVAVELRDAHFGRGHHACPGEHLGQMLAAAAVR